MKFKTEVTGFKSEFKTVRLQSGINIYQGSTATTKKQDVMGINNNKTEFRTFSFVCNDEQNVIAFGVYATTVLTGIQVKILNIKLVEGTEVGEYSKYGQGCVKITKCNKNLFDKDNAIKEYELDGTTGKIMSNSLYFTSDYIRVNPNEQYYLSGKNTGNSNCFYNKDKKFISRIKLENGLLTVPDDLNIYYLRINSRLTAIDTTMLEKNTKKSAYEEHQEQSYIMPIQQPMRSIRDTFIKKENKWYERHYIARRIFNGIANKFNSKHSSIYTDTRGLYQLNLPGKILGTNGSVAYGKSNYLKYKNGNAMDAIYQDCLWWENTSNYNYASIPFLSLTEANEWLVKLNDNGNPFYIDYVLAEPLDIECTEEQSNILDELNNARTYKNVTNITTDSKAILSLDYVKDLETLLNNTQALAVNNASEGV